VARGGVALCGTPHRDQELTGGQEARRTRGTGWRAAALPLSGTPHRDQESITGGQEARRKVVFRVARSGVALCGTPHRDQEPHGSPRDQENKRKAGWRSSIAAASHPSYLLSSWSPDLL
jgi:hypothetical protein